MNDANADLVSVQRLTRDLRQATVTLSEAEARYLVDAYYIIQEDRKRSGNQVRSLGEASEPHSVIQWFLDQNTTLENQIKNALDAYSMSTPTGQWVRSIVGIGPVIAAGLLAHIDVRDPRTSVGQKWRFAGLDPDVRWLTSEGTRALFAEVVGPRGPATPAQAAVLAQHLNRRPDRLAESLAGLSRADQMAALARRPYNATLKTLCWKIGQSLVYQKSHPGDFYGRYYDRRKRYETERNANGVYRSQAEKLLATRNFEDPGARKLLEAGMLVPAHIDLRARRWTVKLFLSHYVEVAFAAEHGTRLREPFAMKLGHSEYIMPPNPPEFFLRVYALGGGA